MMEIYYRRSMISLDVFAGVSSLPAVQKRRKWSVRESITEMIAFLESQPKPGFAVYRIIIVAWVDSNNPCHCVVSVVPFKTEVFNIYLYFVAL